MRRQMQYGEDRTLFLPNLSSMEGFGSKRTLSLKGTRYCAAAIISVDGFDFDSCGDEQHFICNEAATLPRDPLFNRDRGMTKIIAESLGGLLFPFLNFSTVNDSVCDVLRAPPVSKQDPNVRFIAAGQTTARGRPDRACGNSVLPTRHLVESPDQIPGPSDDSKGRPHP
jgi:hypothetical protein